MADVFFGCCLWVLLCSGLRDGSCSATPPSKTWSGPVPVKAWELAPREKHKEEISRGLT